MVAPFVVGFDLDLTLIDSRPGIAATYRELSARTGVYVDADAAVGRLGPPLEVEMALWFAPEEVAMAAALYRRIYPEFALVNSPALPGAAEAFATVREQGGDIVVITGKHAPNAHLHLSHLSLAADAVVGGVWAEAKATAMVTHGVDVYIGDHPADMSAARSVVGNGGSSGSGGGSGPARRTMAVGVHTGDHSAAQLLAAGADVVFANLIEATVWLRQHGPGRRRGVEATFGSEPLG